jgi:hypothetical protein
MRAVRLQVIHIDQCRNGDLSVHVLLEGADGSGTMRDVRFARCTRLQISPLARLDLQSAELDQWRSDHGGQLVVSDLLLTKMTPAVAAGV